MDFDFIRNGVHYAIHTETGDGTARVQVTTSDILTPQGALYLAAVLREEQEVEEVAHG